MGMNNRISSVRPVSRTARYENEAPAPLAAPTYDYRRRAGERLYEVPVTSVRAVVGPPEQRCWIERQQSSKIAAAPMFQAQSSAGSLVGFSGIRLAADAAGTSRPPAVLLPEPRAARTWGGAGRGTAGAVRVWGSAPGGHGPV